MTNSVSPVAKAIVPETYVRAAAASQQSAPADIKVAPAKTTVTISAAGQSAAKAALEEATETPAQTAQEARGNDRQAQRLVAQQAAAEKAALGT